MCYLIQHMNVASVCVNGSSSQNVSYIAQPTLLMVPHQVSLYVTRETFM